MEYSANLYHHHHHHQLQEQFIGYGLSSLHDWNPTISIDEDEYYKRQLDGRLVFPMSADETLTAASSFRSPEVLEHPQYHYQYSPDNVVLQQRQNSEQPDISMTSHCLPVNAADYVVKREQNNLFDLNQSVFLGSAGSGGGQQFSVRFGSLDSSPPPPPPSSVSSCLNSAAAADVFAYTLGSSNHFPSNSYFGIGNFHEAIHSPSSSSNKAMIKNEVLRSKRLPAAMASHHQQQPKKPRTESRPLSCPALKVRKEKLGDRIAALHRLVAPFGKTDTASVLTEAIGYIHFLHDQIHALSMPYLNLNSSVSRSHQPHRTSRVSNVKMEDEKTAKDLRSRGLCLVPLSLTSYISSC